MAIGIYLVAQLFGGLIVSTYPAIKGWDVLRTTEWLNSSLTAQFALILVVEAFTLFLVYAYLKRKGSNFGAIGLKKPKWRDIGFALTGFAAYFLLYVLALTFASKLLPQVDLNQKQDLGFSTGTTGTALVPIFISLVVLPPLVEEILLRGYLYTGLRTRLSIIPAALITSFLFAAAHLQWGSGHALLWVAALDTFVLSLVLVYLREKTGSLWASIGLHMLKNSIAFVSLFILHIS
jgi:membrane protease YdiL (CAAX protease family)